MNVLILYNPNSTGDSKKNAEMLQRELRERQYSGDVKVVGTTHAGHGEEIAAEYAKSGEKVLIVSSSGDGGYHEVINGALSQDTSRVITGLLPSGNANDHHAEIGSKSIVDKIIENTFQAIDTIKVTAVVNGKTWTRYAHSYVGIGVSPRTAKDLTDERPNIFTEKWLVARSLFSFSYVKIRENGKSRRYSSLVFGNVRTMSKIISLSEASSITDGKFEVNSIRFRSKIRLIAYLLRLTTVGVKSVASVREYTFTTIKPLLIQLDGEVYTIDSNTNVRIESVQQNLRCVA